MFSVLEKRPNLISRQKYQQELRLPFFSVLLVILSGSKTTSEYLHNSHSQDILCRVNISNTRGDPLRQLQNKSLCPKDIRFRAHILNTRGDRLQQHQNKSLHPKDIRFRAHMSNTQGDHKRQHQNKSFHPKDIRFRAHISNTQGDHYRQH